MNKDYLRVWQHISLEEIKRHLLHVGDSLGNCENCKELGLDYASVKQCPSCGTDFRYMTSKNTIGNISGRMGIVKRLLGIRHDLMFVDYDDFKELDHRNIAKKFFKE